MTNTNVFPYTMTLEVCLCECVWSQRAYLLYYLNICSESVVTVVDEIVSLHFFCPSLRSTNKQIMSELEVCVWKEEEEVAN